MPAAAIIGGGVIGSAWASRFLLHGWDVRFHDPANSEAVLNNVLEKARRCSGGLVTAFEGAMTLCSSIADAVGAADWCRVHPERLEIKQSVLGEIQASCAAAAIVASSTSGFMPSELQAVSSRPSRFWLLTHIIRFIYCQ